MQWLGVMVRLFLTRIHQGLDWLATPLSGNLVF